MMPVEGESRAVLFFFFQAEDGIRDIGVTGVQTCALPIYLFCAQYCGAFHAGMIGSVIVVDPDEYERWLMGGVQGETMEAAGERLFRENGCITCHLSDGTGPAPSLVGVYGNTVHLTNGQTLIADDAYIRESILSPAAKVVNGYKPVMPSFQGQLSEEQILDLVAYIRSLGNAQGKQQEEGKK